MSTRAKGLKNALLGAIVSVGWTHKINEKQAEKYMQLDNRWKFIQITTAGLTSTGAVSLLLVDSIWAKVIAAVLGLINFVSSGILKAWDYQKLFQQTKEYANNQFILREKLMDCLRDLAFNNRDIDSINDEWLSLEEDRLSLSKLVPATDSKSVQLASNQLKEEEHNVKDTDYSLFIDKEILEALHDIK